VHKALAGQPSQALATPMLELDDQHFFHWPLEFPEVFAKGGFDVVLGNPPWEVLQLSDVEFFSAQNQKIAEAVGVVRKRLINSLANSTDGYDRNLFKAFQIKKMLSPLRASSFVAAVVGLLLR
jgi:hypothetical protein